MRKRIKQIADQWKRGYVPSQNDFMFIQSQWLKRCVEPYEARYCSFPYTSTWDMINDLLEID